MAVGRAHGVSNDSTDQRASILNDFWYSCLIMLQIKSIRGYTMNTGRRWDFYVQ
jgi:hypothetical protein